MERQGVHLRLRDSLTGWVLSLVELGFDPKPGVGARIACQVNNGLEGPQRLASPIVCDVAEQPVLPGARAISNPPRFAMPYQITYPPRREVLPCDSQFLRRRLLGDTNAPVACKCSLGQEMVSIFTYPNTNASVSYFDCFLISYFFFHKPSRNNSIYRRADF